MMIQKWTKSIQQIRNQSDFEEIPLLDNRYCIVVQDGSHEAAYFFSAPIRQLNNREFASNYLVDCSDGTFFLQGTNATVRIQPNEFLFEKDNESVTVKLSDAHNWVGEGESITGNGIQVFPTTNGVAVLAKKRTEMPIVISVTSTNLNSVKSNSKYFAIMEEKHVPLFSLSTVCGRDKYGKLVPSFLKKKSIEEGVRITIDCMGAEESDILFEMNMYEHKIVQDTTVETRHPSENNAFGGVAFLGETSIFGEQWLYMKLDYSLLMHLNSKKIKSAMLYIPILGGSDMTFEAYAMDYRFCSFGSNWNNKVSRGKFPLKIMIEGGFCQVDLANIIIGHDKRLKFSNGFLIKATHISNGVNLLHFNLVSRNKSNLLRKLLDMAKASDIIITASAENSAKAGYPFAFDNVVSISRNN